MATGLRTGLDCKLYYNTGNYSSPVWTLIPIVQSLTQAFDKDKGEVKYRGSPWKKNLFLHKAGPMEFNVIKDTSQATYAVLRDGWLNNTIFDMAVADDLINTTGTEYMRGDYGVFGFKAGQPIDGINTNDVAMDLAYSNNADPSFTTVGS